MEFLLNQIKLVEADNTRWPNRHKEVHKDNCDHCPSKYGQDNGIVDFETEDYKGCPKDFLMKEVVFVCAWRPNKLCKGICDEFGINQGDFKE